MFNFTVNGTSSGRWYFYLDESWSYAYREIDCGKKLAMAKFSSEFLQSITKSFVIQIVVMLYTVFLLVYMYIYSGTREHSRAAVCEPVVEASLLVPGLR